MPVGKISNIEVPRGSGGVTIVFEDGAKVFADNGPFFRAMDDAVGDVIQPDHSVDLTQIIGLTIEYFTADWSDQFIEGFNLIED